MGARHKAGHDGGKAVLYHPPAMTASALAILGFTIVISSFISGVFGMAGGMVLLGQEKGPRFGSFVAVYGLKNTVDMIDGALARSA